MRFSLAGIAGLTWSQLAEAATTAEALGFYGFYASDHLRTPGPGPTTITPSSSEHLDALTAVAALAGHTRSLRLARWSSETSSATRSFLPKCSAPSTMPAAAERSWG